MKMHLSSFSLSLNEKARIFAKLISKALDDLDEKLRSKLPAMTTVGEATTLGRLVVDQGLLQGE